METLLSSLCNCDNLTLFDQSGQCEYLPCMVRKPKSECSFDLYSDQSWRFSVLYVFSSKKQPLRQECMLSLFLAVDGRAVQVQVVLLMRRNLVFVVIANSSLIIFLTVCEQSDQSERVLAVHDAKTEICGKYCLYFLCRYLMISRPAVLAFERGREHGQPLYVP